VWFAKWVTTRTEKIPGTVDVNGKSRLITRRGGPITDEDRTY
jgi:hypothetical protein